MAIDPITGAQTPDVNTPAVAPQAPIQSPQIPIYQAPTYTPGQNFNFDPNQYLPGIQQQAGSIYDPQKAQIDALAKLQTSQTEQKRIVTKEDFAKELERRKEIINQRGAFFGGGAINQENDVLKRESYALTDINTQDAAAQAGFLAQQAGLSAAQAEYVQEKLSGAQGSAYSMWKDSYSMYEDEQDDIFRKQQYDRSIFESDRDFDLKLKEIKANKALSKKERKRAEAEAKEAKRKFDEEMKYKYAALNKKKGSSDEDLDW